MSVTVSDAAWYHSEASGNVLLVLLSLADQANDDGWCWPGHESIASRCRLSRRTVQRAIDTLAELGEVEVERRGRQRTNLYRIRTDVLRAKARVLPHPSGQNGTSPPVDIPQGDAPTAGGDAPPVAREPSVEEPSVSREEDGRALATVDNPTTQVLCATEGCDKQHGHGGPHTNPWWDAVVTVFGYEPADKNEEGLFGRIAAKAKQTGEPGLVAVRAAAYYRAFPDAAFTPPAFDKWWAWLGSYHANADSSQRAAIGEHADKLARRDRLRAIEGGRDT